MRPPTALTWCRWASSRIWSPGSWNTTRSPNGAATAPRRVDPVKPRAHLLAPMDLSALQHLLSGLAATRVVTVGDVMIDRYVYGEVSRVSAEAPIPILARAHESVMLGAAGNVARNIATLGGEASLIGLVGQDGAAHEAMALVGAEPRIEGFLLTDLGRATTVKTRYIAAGQQLLRVDLE